ncbi:mucin-like glycoprotein, partial [Trypanosoma conorhini]
VSPKCPGTAKDICAGGGGMNFFSCGCRALLRELSGLPSFSSFPLPALTRCAAPHRAPHFSLCFFLFAASQPTGSAATLLPPPPPLFLRMALTVRRRAVCALALLALLCGCCASFVCGANAGEVNVFLEVSCPDTGNKLRWRVAGEKTWQACSFGMDDVLGFSGKLDSPSDSVCAWAVFMYPAPVRRHGRSGSAAADTVALTLQCGTDINSEVYKRWLIANKSTAEQIAAVASSDSPGTLTGCATQTSSGEACGEGEEEDEDEDEGDLEGPAEEGTPEEEAATQLTQEADREAGDAPTLSKLTPNSDTEEAEEAEDEKEKEEEKKTEDSGDALASPPSAAPDAADAPRPGATEQAVGAETSERQRGPSPPADGAGTAGPVGDASVQSGPMDDGQAQQTPPSHAPEAVGGVPSASAAPTSETPNAAAKENGAGPQTAADADGGHGAPSNAATAPTAQAPGQPGSPPTRDAAPHLSNSSAAFKNMTGPFPMNTESDGAVRGCVNWLLLLALLGLCGVTAGF